MPIFSWSWWVQRPKKWLAYAVLFTVSWFGFLLFRVINWTRVEGKNEFQAARRQHNGNGRRNVIIVSNHRTMFDSFIVGIIAYFPELLFWPSVAPYHFAAKENFFKNWFTRLILHCLNALPVKPGRIDATIMRNVLKLLPRANLHIFPGGRRSYEPLGSESGYPVRGGIGYIVANASIPPLLIPVFFHGVEGLFGGKPGTGGRSRWFPRLTGIMRRPLIIFGKPIRWNDIIDEMGNKKQAWTAIARRVADAINQLDPEYQAVAGS